MGGLDRTAFAEQPGYVPDSTSPQGHQKHPSVGLFTELGESLLALPGREIAVDPDGRDAVFAEEVRDQSEAALPEGEDDAVHVIVGEQ